MKKNVKLHKQFFKKLFIILITVIAEINNIS